MVKFIKIEDVWFTSDTHFNHNLMLQTRPYFSSMEEHDMHLVEQINKHVSKDSTLIHMGDWSFNGKDNIQKYRNMINCKNIILVFGNHDHHIRGWKVDTDSIFQGCGDILYLSTNDMHVVCCHYPMARWVGGGRGVIMAHGHTHNEFKTSGNILDVGVDSAREYLGEYRPFSSDEFKQVISEKYRA